MIEYLLLNVFNIFRCDNVIEHAKRVSFRHISEMFTDDVMSEITAKFRDGIVRDKKLSVQRKQGWS